MEAFIENSLSLTWMQALFPFAYTLMNEKFATPLAHQKKTQNMLWVLDKSLNPLQISLTLHIIKLAELVASTHRKQVLQEGISARLE